LVTQDVVEGNIMQMTDRVVEILRTKYFTSPIHYEGMQRIETLEVPEDALREILYNSICHKDYTGVHIQMRVWDDYCEVWNEGELPMGYTPETLLNQHSSKPRNKNIAYAFFKAGFIESWGRGYKKIRDGFEGAGLPMPKIESVDGGVKVTFQRNNVSNSQKTILNCPKDGPKDDPKEISERQMLMLKEMDVNDTITIQEMTQKIKVSEKTIKREIALLQGMGALVREGGRKEGRWVVLIRL
jgi:ATP-dependent DNA helicase RecG